MAEETTQIDDGGPAFPGYTDRFVINAATGAEKVIPLLQGGMSLRDFFAAQALQEIIKRHPGSPSHVAECCYEFADAMLAARQQQQKK